MQIKPNKSWWLLGVGVLLGAGAAYAADPRYDTAVEGIDRATTHLTAIGTGTEKPGSAWQRKRALKALERAKLRIACAKEIQDSTSKKRGCPAALKDRFDDNDDDRDDDDHGHHHKDKDKEKAEKEKAEKEKKAAAEKAKKEAAEKAKKEAAEKGKK